MNKKALFNEAKNRLQQKQQGPKGAGRGSSVRAGRQGRSRQDQVQKTGQRKKDNNPATDKGKSGPIYRDENRRTTWKQVYDMRH